MIPYTDFLYFGISLYALLPNFLFGWWKRASKVWVVIATGLMLVIQYYVVKVVLPHTSLVELWLVLGYGLVQYLLAGGFLLIRKRGANRAIFYLVILLSLAPLLAAKFIPLVQASYQLAFIGLSYITFRCLDVIIGIHEGLIHSLPPIQYLTFLLFFPTISSGPIDRYQRFAEDWNHERSWSNFLTDLDGAVHHIFTGFLYKFILAALIKTYWLDVVAPLPGLPATLSYMYAYSLYLFFDFAGYSAFAVGFSNIFGIHTPENFNRPFLAHDIRDFWNRWHMSLSFFFRDHVYNRFVFAALKGRWFKKKHSASYLGFILAMGLMGLWHGTAWHFILYGLYHGVLLIFSDLVERGNKKRKWWNTDALAYRTISVFITFNLVCFGFLIFSGHSGLYMLKYLINLR
jgi:membrane protein involved in D-alanine export